LQLKIDIIKQTKSNIPAAKCETGKQPSRHRPLSRMLAFHIPASRQPAKIGKPHASVPITTAPPKSMRRKGGVIRDKRLRRTPSHRQEACRAL